MYYILENGIARKSEILEWGRWFEKIENRRVEATELRRGEETCKVSTVFLGIDHGYGTDLAILFESMVFGGPLDEEQRRYATTGEAKRGHFELVDQLNELGFEILPQGAAK